MTRSPLPDLPIEVWRIILRYATVKKPNPDDPPCGDIDLVEEGEEKAQQRRNATKSVVETTETLANVGTRS